MNGSTGAMGFILFLLLWLIYGIITTDSKTTRRELKKRKKMERKPVYCSGPWPGCHKEFDCVDCQAVNATFLKKVLPLTKNKATYHDRSFKVIIPDDDEEDVVDGIHW